MYDKVDIASSGDGDLIVSVRDYEGDEYRDLSLVGGPEETEQLVAFRLKTKIGELLLHPDIGNKLEDIIGKRNTRETAEEGKNYIMSAITTQSYIDAGAVKVTPIPISQYMVSYLIEIDSLPYATINMTLEVDLQNGTRRIV